MLHFTKSSSLFTAATLAALTTRSAMAAFCPCTMDPRLVESLSAAGPDLEGIDDIFEGWLGEVDNGNGPAAVQGEGFRSINWDGRAIPFKMPNNFFAQGPVDRGLLLKARTGEFVVSNPSDGSDDLFDSVNPQVAVDFAAFTPERIFTALEDTKFEITFAVPGSAGQEPALVGAFGAIFVDVDLSYTTKLEFYDSQNCLLLREYVEPFSGGHSFLGLKLPEKKIAKVVVTLGNEPLSGQESTNLASPTRVLRRSWGKDIVVMDDFYYDEPVAQY